MHAGFLRFKHAATATFVLAAAMLLLPVVCTAQNPDGNSNEPRGMIATAAGFVALDTPKGWVQADGPGLAFFLPEGVDSRNAEVWMYLIATPIGPKEDDKDIHSAIQSDIAGFKQRFPNGVVRAEEPIALPRVKQRAEVYTFESGEERNAFEQTAYIEDLGRVWIVTASAKSAEALSRSMPVFHQFVQTYGGSIQMGSPPSK